MGHGKDAWASSGRYLGMTMNPDTTRNKTGNLVLRHQWAAASCYMPDWSTAQLRSPDAGAMWNLGVARGMAYTASQA